MLPTISLAQLPRTYEVARAALAECQNIDECKDWADKAAALASYAKQSQDETLMKMATRIKARAARRAGELLAQIEPAHGANQNIQEGDRHNVLTRSDTAREAGMSEHQQKQALRIAAIPEQAFDAQVESPKPPTLTQLAQQGITPKPKPVLDLKGRDPREFNRAMHFIALFKDYARDLGRADLDASLSTLNDAERQTLRSTINAVDAIHDRIMTRI
jgi:hypothetical protein